MICNLKLLLQKDIRHIPQKNLIINLHLLNTSTQLRREATIRIEAICLDRGYYFDEIYKGVDG